MDPDIYIEGIWDKSHPANRTELELHEEKKPVTLLECFEHYNETGFDKPLLDCFLDIKEKVDFLFEMSQVGHNQLMITKLKNLKKLL